jgi:DNA-binding HxlR family transcriptional regulator
MKRYDYDCPIEATFAVIGGKWKAICVFYLIDRPKRFIELSELLETVSNKMLTKQLRELVQDGILERKVYGEMPPRVEYSLTEYGKTLIPIITLMCEWGEMRLEITGKKAVYN